MPQIVKDSLACSGDIQKPLWLQKAVNDFSFGSETRGFKIPGRDASGRLISSQVPHGTKHTSRHYFSNVQCVGCIHRRTLYCWRQCPYNTWKRRIRHAQTSKKPHTEESGGQAQSQQKTRLRLPEQAQLVSRTEHE